MIWYEFNGQLLANTIGTNGTFKIGDATIAIQSVEGENIQAATGSMVTFNAKVNVAEGGIKGVWAVVQPPNPQIVYDLGTPIMRNPIFTLSDMDGDKTYTGSFSGFSCAGEYLVTLFAKDLKNNLATSTAIKVTVTGGENCVDSAPVTDFKATTQVFVSQSVYHEGDTIEIQVKCEGTGFYDQYTAIAYPDGSQYGLLYCLTSMNRMTTDIVKWADSPLLNNTPVTVYSMPIPPGFPKGTYWAYNLLIPSNSDIFSLIEGQWALGSVSFVVE
ncbi:MAG: hypothetical protein HQK64_09055 [Desulfamplus sp.]|nr:hypothetical protein [Desulfamplus sp.]